MGNREVFNKVSWLVVFIVIFGVIATFSALNSGNYQGKLSGIILTNGKSEIVVCDLGKQAFLPVQEIAYQPEKNFATIDRTAKLLAYTQWNAQKTNQYLVVVDQKSGENKIYGQVESGKLCLIVSMIGSASLMAFADSGIGDQKKAVGSGTADNPQLRASHVVMDTTCDQNGNNSWNDYFSTSSAEPHYRVWVENTGDSTISVSVRKDSDSGPIQGEIMTIPAGGQDYMDMTTDNPGNTPGTRYVGIAPTNGAPYSAYVRVRIASTAGEWQEVNKATTLKASLKAVKQHAKRPLSQSEVVW